MTDTGGTKLPHDLSKYQNAYSGHPTIKNFGVNHHRSMDLYYTLSKIYHDTDLSDRDRAVLIDCAIKEQFCVESESDDSGSDEKDTTANKKRKREQDCPKQDIGAALDLYEHIRVHMHDETLYDCDKRTLVFNAVIMAFPDLHCEVWPNRARLNPDGTFRDAKK